jgi:hypothetical protein
MAGAAMQLICLSKAELIAAAGGDPWAINQSLQVGSPLQISNLAEAFHAAGRCTAEADQAFLQARTRFDAAWNHQDGDHPINDSAEVQRTVRSLGAQSLQLPKIGADLENIAATLAEAQKAGAQEISAVERQLQLLDKVIGAATEDLKDPALDAKSRAELQALIKDAKADAVDDTKDALNQLHSIRDTYTKSLQTAQLPVEDAALTAQFKPADFEDGKGPLPATPGSPVRPARPNTSRTGTTYRTSFKTAKGPPSAATREMACRAAPLPSWRRGRRAPGRCRRGPRLGLMATGTRFSATQMAPTSLGSTNTRPTGRCGISPIPLIPSKSVTCRGFTRPAAPTTPPPTRW